MFTNNALAFKPKILRDTQRGPHEVLYHVKQQGWGIWCNSIGKKCVSISIVLYSLLGLKVSKVTPYEVI